jgi:hypothetical protein
VSHLQTAIPSRSSGHRGWFEWLALDQTVLDRLGCIDAHLCDRPVRSASHGVPVPIGRDAHAGRFSIRRQVRDVSHHAPPEGVEVRRRVRTIGERVLPELLLRLDATVRLGFRSVALDEGWPSGRPPDHQTRCDGNDRHDCDEPRAQREATVSVWGFSEEDQRRFHDPSIPLGETMPLVTRDGFVRSAPPNRIDGGRRCPQCVEADASRVLGTDLETARYRSGVADRSGRALFGQRPAHTARPRPELVIARARRTSRMVSSSRGVGLTSAAGRVVVLQERMKAMRRPSGDQTGEWPYQVLGMRVRLSPSGSMRRRP